jgi:stage V sporulation protein K
MSEGIMTTEQITISKKTRQINVVLRNPEPQNRSTEPSKSRLNGKTLTYNEKFAEILKELERMIGLENVKELIYEIYALLQIRTLREEAGLQIDAQVYHMIFKGNPGTGKTTVARIIAKLFLAMGVLTKGHFIEVERADLVGEYIGHTAIKTRELVKKAMGGILFIDEAYSLARGGEKDFGKEAIDSLVKAMEDYKNQFILILAGYGDEMDEFLETNPGLPSRFPIQIEFDDYNVDQLIQISEWMVQERDYSFLPQTVMKLKQHLSEERNSSEPFSNARYVRNQIEKSIRHQAVRLLNQPMCKPSKQDLMIIRPEDLKFDS